jgi:methylated-DNA-[protein]-cysteine S-methyltransferase
LRHRLEQGGHHRFQLPAKSAEATQRMLLRRAPGAESGAPPPEVAEAVAAVKRYFEGEEEDFSDSKLEPRGVGLFIVSNDHRALAAERLGRSH